MVEKWNNGMVEWWKEGMMESRSIELFIINLTLNT
jgi:hypothetical protein